MAIETLERIGGSKGNKRNNLILKGKDSEQMTGGILEILITDK